jgi:predicted transcriptional regulator of viral defense system
MRRPRLELVKEEVFSFFDAQGHRVFTQAQLNELLAQQRDTWKLPKNTTLSGFVDFLLREKKLWMQRFNFSFRPVTLFFWGEVTVYEIAMSLRPLGYLSHLSAMSFHGLTVAKNSRIIYVNDEQEPKPQNTGSLEQGRIDAAFSRRARVSNNKVTAGDYIFYLLSGKNTGRLGVIEKEVASLVVRVTDIERTLIDAVVRPAYSGSIHGVLEAYRRAADRVNVSRLVELLQQLQYIYPYHQAIGFYLDRSGAYSSSSIKLLRDIPQQFDFYLDYEMVDMSYSEEWKLYYPSYLNQHKKLG